MDRQGRADTSQPEVGAFNQRGMALLTVMILLLVMTVLGLAAITVTGLENRIAGNVLGQETAAAAVEACVGTAVNVIQQTIDAGDLPAAYTPNPVPANSANPATGTKFIDEIIGRADNDADAPTGIGVGGSDIHQDVGTYAVEGDIDRLYAKPKAGSATMFASAYDGTGAGAGGGGVDIIYQVDCNATNNATGTSSRIVVVYACTMTGESCQKI